jgi:hypothetical protein
LSGLHQTASRCIPALPATSSVPAGRAPRQTSSTLKWGNPEVLGGAVAISLCRQTESPAGSSHYGIAILVDLGEVPNFRGHQKRARLGQALVSTDPITSSWRPSSSS